MTIIGTPLSRSTAESRIVEDTLELGEGDDSPFYDADETSTTNIHFKDESKSLRVSRTR
jgi:hypothetical protein